MRATFFSGQFSRLHFLRTIFGLLLICLFSWNSKGGLIDLSFVPQLNTNEHVADFLIQPNRKIVVATSTGYQLQIIRPGAVKRLNPDGSLDSTFTPLPAQAAQGLLLQENGKILVAGKFKGPDGTAQTTILRLNPDGTRDPTFNFPDNVGSPQLARVVMQWDLDGKILVGGWSGARVWRLYPNGTRDLTFNSPSLGLSRIEAMAVQTNGAILVGGSWGPLGRLHPDGSVDESFQLPIRLGSVHAIKFQADGKILVGQGDYAFEGAPLFRLNADGSLDNSFQPPWFMPLLPPSHTEPPALSVTGLAVQYGIGIVVGGWFTMVNESPRQGLARITLDGTVDGALRGASLNMGRYLDLPQFANILPDSDGSLVLGGKFILEEPGLVRQHLVRVPIVPFEPVNFIGFGQTLPVQESELNITIALSRTGATNKTVSLRFATENATAAANFDYLAVSGEMIFGPGETQKFLTIPLVPDQIAEGREHFKILFHSPTPGAELSSDQAFVEIHDDDFGVEFAQTDYTVSESGNAALLLLNRVGTLQWDDFSVDLVFSSTNATAGTDYQFPAGRVEFHRTEESGKQVRVDIIDDALIEIAETITIRLSNPSPPAVLGSRTEAVLRIVDNDSSDRVLIQLAGSAATHGFKISGFPESLGLILEASTNLSEWVPIHTNNATSSVREFIDPEAKQLDLRFYRARPF